ncbi:helix-turn-helix transcriptional regulator [Catenuloplanes sp. NPDC051500]|uniref:helix-turn-helix transcriptional regulator n=1 Tax=Catenuloplanes sp. NPDC051500 TaxID=3363959 RepID=UPI0037975735
MTAVFSHGRLRLYLLKLLDDGPKHGYEFIRLLENRFLGLYAPSAGTIYPRLARLEAEGLVTHTAAGSRKTYEITDAGRAELREREDELRALEAEISASISDLSSLAGQIQSQVQGSVRDLKRELREATRATRKAGAERPSASPWGPPGPPPSPWPGASERPSPAGSGPAGSGTAASGTAASGTAASGTAASGTAGSSAAESGAAGSNPAGSGPVGSSAAGSNPAGSNPAGSNPAGSGTAGRQGFGTPGFGAPGFDVVGDAPVGAGAPPVGSPPLSTPSGIRIVFDNGAGHVGHAEPSAPGTATGEGRVTTSPRNALESALDVFVEDARGIIRDVRATDDQVRAAGEVLDATLTRIRRLLRG